MKIHQYNNATDWPNAPWVYVSDLSAHVLKLKEAVEGMPHDRWCEGWARVSTPLGCIPRTRRVMRVEKCNCPRGEALRLIGEVL